jgi:hypothetical protein
VQELLTAREQELHSEHNLRVNL